MKFIGIDPGEKGGISIINEDGSSISFPFSKDALIHVCKDFATQNDVCYLEAVHAMPNQGVTSMFHFGENFGYIQGVLDDNKIKYVLVPPQKWKRYFGLDSDKEKSINKCKELFPELNLFRTPRCKKEHDGMAESMLIAEYGRENYIV